MKIETVSVKEFNERIFPDEHKTLKNWELLTFESRETAIYHLLNICGTLKLHTDVKNLSHWVVDGPDRSWIFLLNWPNQIGHSLANLLKSTFVYSYRKDFPADISKYHTQESVLVASLRTVYIEQEKTPHNFRTEYRTCFRFRF